MNILMIAISVVALLFVLTVVFIHLLMVYAHRMIMQLPWLKWLTYKQVRSIGYSDLMCKGVLPAYHKHGYVEVRVLADLSEEDAHDAEVFGFTSITIELFEFRLTKKNGRRRPNMATFFSSYLVSPQPSRA